MMRRPRPKLTVLALAAVLAAGATLVLWERARNAGHGPGQAGERLLGLRPSSATRLEIRFDGVTMEFVREEDRWRVLASSDSESPLRDTRANQGLLTHLVDAVSALKRLNAQPIDASGASEYGLADPRLALSVEWSGGQDALLLGNSDLTGRSIYAFLPRHRLLVQTSSSILALFDGKKAADLRDRRMTTFEPDDVEELRARGSCGPLELLRDGDRWVWRSPGPPASAETTDAWLQDFLAQKYDAISETGDLSDENDPTFCSLTLRGRKKREETLSVRRSLWSVNSALPARYRAPAELARLLGIRGGSRVKSTD